MKITVLRTPLGEPSLAAVWAIVHHAGAGARHIELLATLKELQTLSGRKLEHLPARMRGLRFLFERIRHGNVLDALALTTLKRQTEVVISLAATIDPAIGNPVPLTPAWQVLINKLRTGRSRSVLRPFAQYCSAWAIAPDAVTDQVAASYVDALAAARFLAKPRDQHRAVCRHWNEAAAKVGGWPAGELKIPDFRPPMRALSWDAFPASLLADVDAYIATKQKPAGRRLRRAAGDAVVETRSGGPHMLVVPIQEVKNRVPLEYPLPSAADALLRRYLAEFRPRLVGDDNDWLFPGQNGRKCSRTLSQQITERLETDLGFHMTPHQFRHAAAAWLLLANPGNYETVRRLLGHKQLQTTINFYVGLESIAAARQYQEMLLRDMQEVEA